MTEGALDVDFVLDGSLRPVGLLGTGPCPPSSKEWRALRGILDMENGGISYLRCNRFNHAAGLVRSDVDLSDAQLATEVYH
jgi:hypothetical protein